MRGGKRSFAGAIVALTILLSNVGAAFGQQTVHPIDDPRVRPPVVRPTMVPVPRATLSPSAPATPSALPTPTNPADLLANSRLGPPMPLSRLARLPRQTPANTATVNNARIPLSMRHARPMSAEFATLDYAEVSNCGSSVGMIFNVGCTIEVRGVQGFLHDGDTLQNYYIDATNNLAQTLGGTYSINSGGGNYFGPYSNVTLSHQGTYVLGVYDNTIGAWLAVVYITVGSANGIATYADSTLRIPQTNFTIPAAGQTYVYINVVGLPPSDSYVTYIEQTSTNPTCVYYAPAQTLAPGNNKGLCDPNSSIGQTAPGGTLTIAWPVTSSYLAAAYSVVIWDRTQGHRIAQTQVSLRTAAVAARISLTPTGGNPSPGPNANPTPGTRFAFNNTTDQSDNVVNINMSGLIRTDFYCFSIADPNGRVYANQSSGSYDVTCGNPNSTGALSLPDTLLNNYQPLNYAPNTYTVSAYDASGGNYVAASQAFQVLGYNALTQFTDSAGTTVVGNALVLPSGSSDPGGLQFTNDGDTYFGVGNGDTLNGLFFDTGGNGITMSLGCGPTCLSETVTDSVGQTWTVTLVNSGGGANADSKLTLYPQTPGQFLPMNASVVVPNMLFNNGPGNARCTGGCTGLTSILPTDGQTWSVENDPSSSNPVFFTNSGGKTYAGTASVTHLGLTNTGSGYVGGAAAGEEQHGYYPRQVSAWSGALYSTNEPFTEPTNLSDVYAVTVTNNSSGSAGNMTGIAIVFPAGYSTGSYAIQPGVDSNSPSKWQIDATNCPAGLPPNGSICLKPAGANTGVSPGTSQTIYLDVQNDPPSSFAYTDFTIEAYKPAAFSLTPATQQTVFVGVGTPVDSTAVAAYSLDGGLITPLFTPQSEGTNTNNPVEISVQNTTTAQDPNPDYVDTLVIELPNGVVNPTNFTSLSPSTWQYLGSAPGFGSSTTDYWFGVCASQFATADGPVQNPPPVKPALPACSQAVEQNALAPGATFQFTSPLATGSSAGTITGTMYAHGANGDGWSKGHAFNLTVTPVAATAGFVQLGAYGSPSAIASNTTPQVGADSNTTYGNTFVYEIHNTSSAGNNINSAKITIPYLDTSGADARDNNGTGQGWQITAAPTLSGSGWTNCGVTYTNPTGGSANGFINIVNSGGTCTITPGGKLDITFPMKAPYRVNETAQFPAVVNGSVNAAENWFSDTDVQVILSAQLGITVWPGAGPGGSNPVPSCTLTCTFVQATNLLDFGTVANLQNNTGTDVATVSVYTNAANPIGWNLYVSVDNNPVNSGAPAHELLSSIDSTHSSQGTGLNFDATGMTVVPTSGNGTLLVDTGAGAAPRRLPYDVVNNLQVNINGGVLTPQQSIMTFTFISN